MTEILLEILEEILEEIPDLEPLVIKLRLEKIAKGSLSEEFLVQSFAEYIKKKSEGIKLRIAELMIERLTITSHVNDIFNIICVILEQIKSSEDKRRGLRSLLWLIDESDLPENAKVVLLEKAICLLRGMEDFDLSEVLVTLSHVAMKLKSASKERILRKILEKINQLKEDSQIAKAVFAFLDFSKEYGVVEFVRVHREVISKIIEKISNPKWRQDLHQKLIEVLEE